jgi:two-component system response regulator AtoC
VCHSVFHTVLHRDTVDGVSDPPVDNEASAVGDALDVARGPSLVTDLRHRVRVVSPAARRLLAGARVGMPLARATGLDERGLQALGEGRPVEIVVSGESLRLRATALGDAASRSGWLVTVTELAPSAARGAVCFHGMWTQDPALKEVFRVIDRVAVDDATVLIRGETGTGKELVAQAIHAISPRRRGPFRAINCAALPATLLESELFGHLRGAFTGAVRDQVGLLASADGGTLFLDEVAEMPLELQATLLRVLETRTVLPVGARDPVPVDVRILSATHKALRKEAEAGRFRRDLLYRLRVIPVFLPPLRDRPGDVGLLCDRLIAEMSPRSRRPVERVAPAALDVLDRHDWPGNVRELRNVLAYAYAIGDGPVIVPEDLPPELLGAAPREIAAPPPDDAPAAAPPRRAEGPDARRILDALARAGGNRERAAQALGMSRVTLWRHMRQLGIAAPGR